MVYSEAQWRSFHHLHFIVLRNAMTGLEQVANKQFTTKLIMPDESLELNVLQDNIVANKAAFADE